MLGLAGVIKLRKRSFSITRREMAMLDDAKVGELLALLLHTHLRDLNLAYLSPTADELAPPGSSRRQARGAIRLLTRDLVGGYHARSITIR